MAESSALVALDQADTRNGSKASDDWETPDSLFTAYEWEFAFTIDVAAQSHNTKLPGFAENGLKMDWTSHRVWCNPPYSDIEPWVAKGAERKADVAVFLLPVRPGTEWWLRYVHNGDQQVADSIRFFRKRIKFIGAPGSPAWDSCLVIYRRRP